MDEQNERSRHRLKKTLKCLLKSQFGNCDAEDACAVSLRDMKGSGNGLPLPIQQVSMMKQGFEQRSHES